MPYVNSKSGLDIYTVSVVFVGSCRQLDSEIKKPLICHLRQRFLEEGCDHNEQPAELLWRAQQWLLKPLCIWQRWHRPPLIDHPDDPARFRVFFDPLWTHLGVAALTRPGASSFGSPLALERGNEHLVANAGHAWLMRGRIRTRKAGHTVKLFHHLCSL